MGRVRIVNNKLYNDDFMTFEECVDTIRELSKSQGFYGRLLRDLYELDDSSLTDLIKEWESMKFKNTLDFIEYLEN